MSRNEQSEHPPETDLDRVQANREIGRAFRAVQAVRTFFWALAAGNGLLIWLWVMLASMINRPGRTVTPILYVAIAIYGGLIPLYIVGALRLHKEPFLWSLVVALVQSVAAVLRLLSGIDVWAVLSALLAVFCWAAFAVIAPAIRLMKRYPDLRISQRLRGRRAGSRRRAGA